MTGVKTVSYTNDPTYWRIQSLHRIIPVPANMKAVSAKRKTVLAKTIVTQKMM